MSIALSNSLAREAAFREDASAARAAAFKVGDTAELTVLERAQNGLYKVLLGNSQRTVQSTSELSPGSRLVVQITATGERLVLRSADPRIGGVSFQETVLNADAGTSLATLARRHHVALDREHLGAVEQAMQQVDEPLAMAAAGLFLGKLGLQLDSAALQALYEAQVWPSAAAALAHTSHLTVLEGAEQVSTTLLKHLSKDEQRTDEQVRSVHDPALSPPYELAASNSELAADQHDAHDQTARRDLAEQLLNAVDGGALAHQYGVLPLLIADQLVELDVVCFHSAASAVPAGLRRLTMTFNSKTLGRVEVHAEALGSALVLNIRAASQAPTEALAAHADDVRSLIARLGWRVDSLSYQHGQVPRAAAQLVQHVLRTDTLDRWL